MTDLDGLMLCHRGFEVSDLARLGDELVPRCANDGAVAPLCRWFVGRGAVAVVVDDAVRLSCLHTISRATATRRATVDELSIALVLRRYAIVFAIVCRLLP